MTDYEKGARQFAKLTQVDFAFRQVRALADELASTVKDPLVLTFAPQVVGIVMTYAKHFVPAAGLSLITDDFPEFAEFDEGRYKDTTLRAPKRASR